MNIEEECGYCSLFKLELEIAQAELEECRKELADVKEHLKKYTAPERSRVYYQTHKHEIASDPEYKKRRKEINQRAYQKRKAKLSEQLNEKASEEVVTKLHAKNDNHKCDDCDTDNETPDGSPTKCSPTK
jgi:excinuclease UvrABC ATPase subunit